MKCRFIFLEKAIAEILVLINDNLHFKHNKERGEIADNRIY